MTAADPMWAAEVVEPTADFLAPLAWDGKALELGIGTGRIALAVARRGVHVTGIDLSPDVVTELPVVHGDFSTTQVDGVFSLVYLVFNTIMNVTSQDGQVAVFANAARHLVPGGFFVIETMLPALRLLPPGEVYVQFAVEDDYVGIDEYDVVNQGLVSHHYRGGERSSGAFRYVWPAELDLMARRAGLELHERVAGWDRAPFAADSRSHVSVWRKPS